MTKFCYDAAAATHKKNITIYFYANLHINGESDVMTTTTVFDGGINSCECHIKPHQTPPRADHVTDEPRIIALRSSYPTRLAQRGECQNFALKTSVLTTRLRCLLHHKSTGETDRGRTKPTL